MKEGLALQFCGNDYRRLTQVVVALTNKFDVRTELVACSMAEFFDAIFFDATKAHRIAINTPATTSATRSRTDLFDKGLVLAIVFIDVNYDVNNAAKRPIGYWKKASKGGE